MKGGRKVGQTYEFEVTGAPAYARLPGMGRFLGMLVLVVAVVLTGCSDDSPSEPDPYGPALQGAIDDAIRSADLFGLTAAVIAPGRGLWTSASGFSEPATQTPMEADHVMGVGGVTSSFTAALALKLVEDGLLILDAPISNYITPAANVNGTATVRQLMNHTAGVFDFSENSGFFPAIFSQPDRVWTSSETLSYVLAPPFAPGADWALSNSNYVVLGQVIEAVTGASFVDLLRGRLLVPQGLSVTSLAGFEPLGGEVPHVFFDLDGNQQLDDVSTIPRTALMTAVGASGAVFTTAAELAQWADALYHGRVLTNASMDEMLDTVTFGNIVGLVGYGLGSSEWFFSQGTFLGANASTVGSSGCVMYSVDNDITVALLTNKAEAGGATAATLLNVGRELTVTAALNR